MTIRCSSIFEVYCFLLDNGTFSYYINEDPVGLARDLDVNGLLSWAVLKFSQTYACPAYNDFARQISRNYIKSGVLAFFFFLLLYPNYFRICRTLDNNTCTSTLIRIAQQLKHEEFRKVFGGKDNVWPNRYEAAHGYLTRVINNAENAVEYHKRCGFDRAAASDIGAGTTQAWAVFDDTRQLPEEDIPLLTKTQSGQDFGWPSGLMGPVSTSRLHAKGITRTSQLIQSANRLDHEQFKQ